MNAFTKASAAATPGSFPAPVSVYHLGLQLGVRHQESHLLDVLHTRLGSERPTGPMTAQRLAQRHAATAHEACTDECYAIEDLILSSKAYTLADAAVQVMVAAARLNIIANGSDEREVELEEKRVYRVLQGLARLLGAHAGVELASVGGRYYASTWCDPRPEVDLSGVLTDASGIDTCIDGSGGEA